MMSKYITLIILGAVTLIGATTCKGMLILKKQKYLKEIEHLIRSEFKNELGVDRIIKSYPAEPLKKWEGRYLIILVDSVDNEEFLSYINTQDNPKEIIRTIEENREKKDSFINYQKGVSLRIRECFGVKFRQITHMEGKDKDSLTEIEFFLGDAFVKEKNIKYNEELLSKIKLRIPNSCRVFINITEKPQTVIKDYYSYSEKGIFYRVNIASFGSSSDFFVSRTKFNSPMHTLNPNVKARFMNLMDEISSQNYFYKHSGLFIDLLRQATIWEKIEEQAKKRVNSHPQIIFGYLDVNKNGCIGIRGIMTNTLLDEEVDQIYPFFYSLEKQNLDVYTA